MAAIKGINLPAPVVPYDDLDIYPSHLAVYGKGGHRTVNNIFERDNIKAMRREEGMLVYVISDNTIYKLKHGFPTAIGSVLNSTNWEEWNAGSGPSAGLTKIFTSVNGVSSASIITLPKSIIAIRYNMVIKMTDTTPTLFVSSSDIQCINAITSGTDISEYGIIGDRLDYDLSLQIVGTNIELILTNNESYNMDIELLEINIT